jgi:DNA-binding CsgD family transcriptional regulator
MEGRYQAGISGFSEFESLDENHQLRILAVLTNKDIHGLNVPDFKSLGIMVEHLNWRGVFAPPGIDATQTAALSAVIEKMVRTQKWQASLQKHHWLDAYLAGAEFVDFVKTEQDRVADDLKLMVEADPAGLEIISNVLLRRYTWALGLAGLSILLVVVLLLQRHRAHRREEGLQQAYEAATGKALHHTEELERALADVHTHIELEFDKWNLTAAEKEIALLLLKGLRLKDIADARGTSERTVRQQAQAVYKKAGLEGRFELAAYFIEDVMHSMELAESTTEPT